LMRSNATLRMELLRVNCNRYPCDDRLIDCTEIDCCIRSVVYSYFVLLSRLIFCEKARGNGMPREFAKAGSVAHSIFCVPRVWYSSHCRVLVVLLVLLLVEAGILSAASFKTSFRYARGSCSMSGQTRNQAVATRPILNYCIILAIP
jgi:hypothetical protein